MKSIKSRTENIITTKRMSRCSGQMACALVPLVLFCLPLLNLVADEGDRKNGNTVEGLGALQSLTTGHHNTALGYHTLFSLTEGGENTATGSGALANSTADFNTADGFEALSHNLTGFHNLAVGWRALSENTIGFLNTAVGAGALLSNTTGIDNTATGAAALHDNIKGRFNTANGYQALAQNTTADANTAEGSNCLLNNTKGDHNTAIGEAAMMGNMTGRLNTAVGVSALGRNVDGGANIALGFGAGAAITGDYNIDIGNGGVIGEGNTIRIGETNLQLDTYIAGIFGTNLVGPPVVITADGHLGVGASSSARFKDDIKPMNNSSEAILALKPVTFHYKERIDPNRTPQYGLVAEEVEKVNPDLVTRDAKGAVYTVRYEAVNAMLLNEFLKAHRKIEDQQKQIDTLNAELKEQLAVIQQVRAEVEMNKSGSQMVSSNH